MKSEHNLSIEQLQLIKLIENINQKYRQRCNIDKNKVFGIILQKVIYKENFIFFFTFNKNYNP